ncbi:FKBP-type peptidyl-prolyl cis-trans isomerase [Candidatus Micrarchaeota archaeon]|nr:FKBP-type peptidyl-prolyl cis-trans isomerase [Candidatus Micrarchaeota archaeon]
MVEIKPGDLIRIDYVLRRCSDNSIIDTTMEEVAKKAGIYSPQFPYAPKLVVFGMGRMVAGLEAQLPLLEIGVKKEVKITSENAFGEKKKDLMRVLVLGDFLRQNVQPRVGMGVSLDNKAGIIKSINSGRVVVDFNRPFAGEDLLYSITLLEVVSDQKKKLEAILSAAKVEATVIQTDGGFDVEFKKENPTEQEIAVANAAIRAISPNAQVKLKEEEMGQAAKPMQAAGAPQAQGNAEKAPPDGKEGGFPQAEGKPAQEEKKNSLQAATQQEENPQKLHSRLASKKAIARSPDAAAEKKN